MIEGLSHITFVVSDLERTTDLIETVFDAEKIRACGLEVEEGRSRVKGEGRSLYFHDHDNHLFELHSGTLDERLARYGAG